MTIEEAINWYTTKLAVNEAIKLNGPQNDAARLALAALRAQQEQPNEPLTLDELRHMDREPVWLYTFSSVRKKTNISQWAILEAVTDTDAVFVRAGCNSRLTKRFSNYGETWLAYRRKPEGVSS